MCKLCCLIVGGGNYLKDIIIELLILIFLIGTNLLWVELFKENF